MVVATLSDSAHEDNSDVVHWARMYIDDVIFFSEIDVDNWFSRTWTPGHVMELLKAGPIRERFLDSDPTILRKAYFSNVIDEQMQHVARVHQGNRPPQSIATEEARGWICQVGIRDTDQPCNLGEPFPSYKAYQAHLQKYHGIESDNAKINKHVITNQCPACREIFKSRIVAKNHLVRSIERERCVTGLTRENHEIKAPDNLICPICLMEDDKHLDSLQTHIYNEHLQYLMSCRHFHQFEAGMDA